MATPPALTPVPDGSHDTHLRLLLRDALLSLPPRQRAVLVLRYLEDRSVDETAQILGCRPGTVASQAARALAKLRVLVPPDDQRKGDHGKGDHGNGDRGKSDRGQVSPVPTRPLEVRP